MKASKYYIVEILRQHQGQKDLMHHSYITMQAWRGRVGLVLDTNVTSVSAHKFRSEENAEIAIKQLLPPGSFQFIFKIIEQEG